MVSQCVNIYCSKFHQPPEHESFCTACRHSLVSTPDYGSMGAHQVFPGSLNGFPYEHASPANSSSFYGSPAYTGYSPSVSNLPAFPYLRTGHNSPALRISPTLKHQHSPYLAPHNFSATVPSRNILAVGALAITNLLPHRLALSLIPFSRPSNPGSIPVWTGTTNRTRRRGQALSTTTMRQRNR